MKVHINKTICKFLFLHDLSTWHYSARKHFRDYWTRTPLKLSKEERVALVSWRSLNKNFYKEKKVFLLNDYLSGRLKKTDKDIVDNVFEIFEPRFEFHYKKQLLNMKKIVKYLKGFENSPYLQRVYRFYEIKESRMPVYVTMSHNANKSAGGMQLGNMVILQFGDYKLNKDNSPILNVLFHELTHKGSVSKFLPANTAVSLPHSFTGDVESFIDEVIHKALWSEIGVFSQKQFGWSNQKIEKSYKLLMDKLESPYREMIKKVFLVRKYLIKKFLYILISN